ncbi:MAG: metallopeptidase TldD-related protein [Elusimicrobia bacterium]|nr:metallopeptidase TldD-related protein [Elusimicrobiota bacterium]
MNNESLLGRWMARRPSVAAQPAPPRGGRRFRWGTMAVLVLGLPIQATAALPANDVVFRAMQDEMSRNMRRLRMDDLPGPYYLAYTVREGTQAFITAGFGALEGSQISPFLEARVQVRVGDSSFDNTNFVPAGFGSGGPGLTNASFEDDYDNLRFSLWSLTDETYKSALESLAKKKAFREKHQIVESLDDFSGEPPVQRFEPLAWTPIDRGLWERRLRELSAVFRDFPEIQDSRVDLSFFSGTKRFLNSEGTAVRGSDNQINIEVSVNTQGRDGLRFGDSEGLHYPAWADVPSQTDLLAEVRRFARGVADVVHGSTVEAYVGPVLFEDEAAAEFFDVQLVDNISSPRGSWSEDENNRVYDPPPFVSRLGMRVAVPWLSFVDDPLLERYGGVPLFGHYDFDDEGVPARRLDLVRKGKLVDLYMSRAPIRELKHSNGHGRSAFFGDPSGRMGSLIVTPEKPVPLSELKDRMRAMCRDLELDYGIVVREMGGLTPVRAYKVYAADGREEPLAGVEFVGAGFRPLRDIVAASKEMYVFNFLHGSTGRTVVPASIVAPSILVQEMELRKTERKPERLHYLKKPFFAGKGK